MLFRAYYSQNYAGIIRPTLAPRGHDVYCTGVRAYLPVGDTCLRASILTAGNEAMCSLVPRRKNRGGEKPSGDNSASCSTFGRRDQNVASKLHTMHSEKRTMDTQGS